MAIAFIIQALFLTSYASTTGKRFIINLRTSTKVLLEQYENISSSPRKWWWFHSASSLLPAYPQFRTTIEFRIIERLFIHQHNLSPGNDPFVHYALSLFGPGPHLILSSPRFDPPCASPDHPSTSPSPYLTHTPHPPPSSIHRIQLCPLRQRLVQPVRSRTGQCVTCQLAGTGHPRGVESAPRSSHRLRIVWRMACGVPQCALPRRQVGRHR